MMFSHPIVATSFALLLAPLASLAPAQEVTLYSTDFTTMDGWTNSANCHPDYIWAADATPASHFAGPYVSPPASLNFNNGVDVGGPGPYGSGDISCGKATSDPIDLSLAAGVPWLRFMASWNYESGCQWDILAVRVLSASSGAVLFQIPCLDNGAEYVPWTAFEFPLESSWGGVRIEFEFHVVDGWANAGTGAFIDDLSVVDVLPISAFCSGDGSATSCPCGNTGAPGAGCVNSTGAGSPLVASGSPAVSAGNLVLEASHIRPNQLGLYFEGSSNMNGGDGVVFGDGLLCASGNLIRLQSVQSDAGGYSATTIDIALKGNASPGDTRFYQFWYRDPVNSPCSDGFNLSNGIQITWTP